jgi:hypothetical protein
VGFGCLRDFFFTGGMDSGKFFLRRNPKLYGGTREFSSDGAQAGVKTRPVTGVLDYLHTRELR